MPDGRRWPLWAGRTAAPVGIVLVAFAGTGIGTVLLPSVVRRYFSDRVALLTAVYACVVGVSTAVPAALAAPVAQQAGWRISLGIWSVTSITALIP